MKLVFVLVGLALIVASAVAGAPNDAALLDETAGSFMEYSDTPLAAVEQDAEAALGVDADLGMDIGADGVNENDEQAEGPTAGEQEEQTEQQQGAEDDDAAVEGVGAHDNDEQFAGLSNRGIFKKMGQGIKNAAKKTWNGVKAGAKWAGKKVWSGVKAVGKTALNGAVDAVFGNKKREEERRRQQAALDAKFAALDKRIAEISTRDASANAATDAKVDKALRKLRRLHRTMQELRRLMTQIKTHVVSLLPTATANRYANADKSTISHSQFSKTLVEQENKLVDPWHPNKFKGAEYNEDVIKPTLPTVDEQDDDAAQELAADAKTVSKESRTMAKKDDISLVL